MRLSRVLAMAAVGVLIVAAVAQVVPGRAGAGQGVQPQVNRRPLPWSAAAGKPNIPAGHSVGFYIWHDGNTAYVVSTSESDKGQKFGGRITVRGGTITDVKGMKLEKKDRFQQPKPNVVTFRFDTHEAEDGLQFTVNGGKGIVFNLRHNGHKVHVFYGGNATDSDRDPVVFNLSK